MSAETIEDTLPPIGPELIRVAIRDLEAAERDPAYKIDMAYWHDLLFDDRCHVCLAGAVLAKSLHLDPGAQFHPRRYDHRRDSKTVSDKMLWLDDARRGMPVLGISFPVASYLIDPRLFKKQLLWIADHWPEDDSEKSLEWKPLVERFREEFGFGL